MTLRDTTQPNDNEPLVAVPWTEMPGGCAPFLAQCADEYDCDAPNIRAWLVILPLAGFPLDVWFASARDAATFMANASPRLPAVTPL